MQGVQNEMQGGSDNEDRQWKSYQMVRQAMFRANGHSLFEVIRNIRKDGKAG